METDWANRQTENLVGHSIGSAYWSLQKILRMLFL